MTKDTNAPVTKVPATWMGLGGILGIVGAVLTFMNMGGEPDAMAGPWLYGAMFWSMISFGFLGLTLLFHLTRGRWGTPLLRIFEAGGGPVHMVLAGIVLFAVCWFWLGPTIYGNWLDFPETDTIVKNKQFYLNETAFVLRSIGYFVFLTGIAFLFKYWTRQEELTGKKKWHDLRANWTGLVMVGFFVVMTFLTTDYVMSIDPHWYSTIWGLWFVVGGALGAMALAISIVVSQSDKAPFAGRIDNMMRNDFGNLLLMLTMLWGYFSFSQLLIIWSGNLKEFIPFYLARLRGGFSSLGKALFLCQFLLPFMLMLSPTAKKSKVILAVVAAWIFLFRLVDMYWIIFPYFRTTAAPSPGDFGPLLLIGGIWLFAFGWNLKLAPMWVAAHPYQDKEPLELKEATQGV